MKGALILCLVFAIYRGAQAAASCGTADKCLNPVEDFKTLFSCRISDVFSKYGQDQIIKAVVSELCQGMNTDQIAAHIKETMMKGVDLGTMGKVMSVVPPFESCLKQYNTDVNSLTTALSNAFKKQFAGMFTHASIIAGQYKGKCSDPGLVKALGQFACPVLTHDFVQQFLVAAKAEVGPSFACWKKVLDGKVVNLSQYNV